MMGRMKVINYHTLEHNKYPTDNGMSDGNSLIECGEIAINCCEGSEQINILNSNNKIVSFKDWGATESLVQNSRIKIKILTLEGDSGVLPLSEWDEIINSDLFIVNSTYCYSFFNTETNIHFDIVTGLLGDGNGNLTSLTITFYDLTKNETNITWTTTPYQGVIFKGLTQDIGTDTELIMSQNAVTTQINNLQTAINSNTSEITTIKNEYQKKIISVPTSETSKTLQPNTYYKWGTMTSLTITLATNVDSSILNEYMFEFVSGTTPTTLSLPSSIKWLNGEAPIIEQNKTYQVSIVNNLAIICLFS